MPPKRANNKDKAEAAPAAQKKPVTAAVVAAADAAPPAAKQPTAEELNELQQQQQAWVARVVDAVELKVAPVKVPEGIDFSTYTSASQLPAIMKLVEKDLSEPYSVFTYRYFVQGWPELTIMAREGDQLLGVIVCKCDRQNRRKRLRGYIAMLAVDSTQRKRGIGSYLAHAAIVKMKDVFRCDEVVLETELTNLGALSLYERLGFVRDKRLCRYYLNGGDAFRLKLWFTSPVSYEEAGVLEMNEKSEEAPTTTTTNVEEL